MGLDVSFYEGEYTDKIWDVEKRIYVTIPDLKNSKILEIKKPYLFLDWVARIHNLDKLENQCAYPITHKQAYELLKTIDETDPNDIRKTFPCGQWSDGNDKWELQYHGTYMWELDALKSAILTVLSWNKYADTFWIYIDH